MTLDPRPRPARPALAAAAAAALVLALLTLDVVLGGPLTLHETLAMAEWHPADSPRFDVLAAALSRTGGPSAISVYAALLVALYAAHRRLAAAAVVGTVLWGSALGNVALKTLVQRSRPVFDAPLAVLHTWSFPSGHAVASMTLAGVAWLVVRDSPAGTGTRLGVAAAAFAWALLVCASRVWLGVHWPVDVAGGTAAAALWVALAAALCARRGIDLGWPARRRAP